MAAPWPLLQLSEAALENVNPTWPSICSTTTVPLVLVCKVMQDLRHQQYEKGAVLL